MHRCLSYWTCTTLCLASCLLAGAGCASMEATAAGSAQSEGSALARTCVAEVEPGEAPAALEPGGSPGSAAAAHVSAAVRPVSHQSEQIEPPVPEQLASPRPLDALVRESVSESLRQIEAAAVAGNPVLRALAQQAEAARARIDYVGRLPDPTVSTNLFLSPIETAAGAQRATLSVMQMIPWLARLDARVRQAYVEALIQRQEYELQRLRVIGDIRAHWCRLYSLGKQLETNAANQELLQSLVKIENSRVETGSAELQDVLLGTVEISRLSEQNLRIEQQIVATKAELNRLAGRAADYPVATPTKLQVALPDWPYEMLRQMAWERQPAIATAELRRQATRWGVVVAQLQRRPDVSIGASWYAIDDNRPLVNIVQRGRDAWSIGAQMTIPLGHAKYAAMEREARWKHGAAHASVDAARQEYDALLRDLWSQAVALSETATLYESTILPQARQSLTADQQSYANRTVDFDRVVRDLRNVLALELGYHQAIGELAATLARIQQAVGADLAPRHWSLHIQSPSLRALVSTHVKRLVQSSHTSQSAGT